MSQYAVIILEHGTYSEYIRHMCIWFCDDERRGEQLICIFLFFPPYALHWDENTKDLMRIGLRVVQIRE